MGKLVVMPSKPGDIPDSCIWDLSPRPPPLAVGGSGGSRGGVLTASERISGSQLILKWQSVFPTHSNIIKVGNWGLHCTDEETEAQRG